MTTRTRLLTSAAAILSALLPRSVAAITIYCGELPGCVNASVRSFMGSVMNMLIVELPLFIYFLGGLFIVIGGMYIVLSAGNSEQVTKGKNTIIWAAAGIFIMQMVANTLTNPLTNFLEPELFPLTTQSGPTIIPSAINVAINAIKDLLTVALLGVAIFSGARMVLSGGKEDQYNKGREGLFWAAVGAIIINLAGAIHSTFSGATYTP